MDHDLPETDVPQPLLSHLAELRKRLLYCVAALVLVFPICYAFKEPLYGILLKPLAAAYGTDTGKRLIYTGLTEAFFVYIKTALYAAFMVVFPVVLTQVWRFVAPGLYKHEQKLFRPFLVGSPLLFIAGAMLAYFLVIPMAWHFFLSFESNGAQTALPIQLEARVSEYLSLVMTLLFAFGLSFQLPLVLLTLVHLGVFSLQDLQQGRRYAIVIIMVLAAILTPPDVFSQLALAIPMILLYELSILILKRQKTYPLDMKNVDI